MNTIRLSALLLPLFLIGEAQAQYFPQSSYSPEQLVASWYRRYLRRPADPYAGPWVGHLRSGMSPQQALSLILGSNEYYQRIAGGTPRGFIRQLFLDLAGRQPTPREARYWLRQLYARNRNEVAYLLVTRYAPSGYGGGYEPPYGYGRPFSGYRR